MLHGIYKAAFAALQVNHRQQTLPHSDELNQTL